MEKDNMFSFSRLIVMFGVGTFYYFFILGGEGQENEDDELNYFGIFCISLQLIFFTYPVMFFTRFLRYEWRKARDTYSKLMRRINEAEAEEEKKENNRLRNRVSSSMKKAEKTSSAQSLLDSFSVGSITLRRASFDAEDDEAENPHVMSEAPTSKERLAPSFVILDHIAYRLDYWFSSSPLSKPVALFIASISLIIVGGMTLWGIGSGNFSTALWTSWTFVADPGTHADQEGLVNRGIAFSLTIGGMIIFALLIGIVADEISSQVDSLKRGRSHVIEVDHTLICGWSGKTLPIIRELSLANESENGGLIVILADREKEEMETSIKESGIDFKGTEIICRSGNGLSMNELKKVSAHMARSIIILADETSQDADGSDARALRSVLSLIGLLNHYESKCHIVVEIRDIDNKALVELVGENRVETVVAHDVIGRLMIQSSRQPALAHILAEILSFNGCEIYFSKWNALNGVTFKDALFMFEDAIPIGVKSKGEILLNPQNDFTFQMGDEIIVVAEDDDTYQIGPSFYPKQKIEKSPITVKMKAGPEKMLYCGWRRDIDDMISELDKVCSPGSELWLMSSVPMKKREVLLADGGLDITELKNIKLVHRMGNTVLRRHLEALPIEEFNSILILADQDYENNVQDADSRSLASLLLIRDIQRLRQGVDCTLVSEILDAQTMVLVKVAKVSDFIMSNAIISSTIAQVAENRDMNRIWGELLTDEGMETYMRPISPYIPSMAKNKDSTRIIHGEASFAQIMAIAQKNGEIAIGYKKASEALHRLNPADKLSPLKWTSQDVLVVIADD